ncbi:SCO3374 family protein [Streptomyces sp. YKOK-I1]
MVRSIPLPRRPDGPVRGWYENELGWATVPGEPVRLSVGDRFDVLEVPAEAGRAALGRRAPDFPVAVHGGTGRTGRTEATGGTDAIGRTGRTASTGATGGEGSGTGCRMRLLVAAGSAEELPGILQWLEWGGLPLDLTALGEGSLMEAPMPPGLVPGCRRRTPVTPVQGAAVWLRPPVAGCEVEASLPTVSASGGVKDAPDLVRLVDTLAAHCHRVRLRRLAAQPLAFS